MPDIKATLGLESSQYEQGLKSAENQAVNFANKFKSNMDKINSGVDSINGKFQNLTHALVGVGIVGFIHSLLEGANQLKDLSDGLGVSVERFMEMRLAATASGSSLEGMAKMLAKMEQAIGNAAEGNYQFQESLAKVGLSTKEYFSLSPDQQFLKVAEGLAKIENPAERTRLKLELLGKGAISFDPESYIKKINQLYGSMDKYGESQRKASEVSEALRLKTELVTNSFLKLIEPIVSIAANTGELNSQMSKAEGIAKMLGAALAVFIGSALINAVTNIAGAFKSLTVWMGYSKIQTEQNSMAMLLNANAAIFVAAAHGRLGSATSNLANIEERLSIALASGTATKAQIEKLEIQLTMARERLAGATAGLAATEEKLALATTGVAVASEGAAVATGALGTALGIVRGAMAFIASVASTVISVILSLSILNDFTKNAENKGWWDQMAEGLEKLTRWASPALADAIERIGSALGMKPGTTAPDDVKKKWDEAQKKAKEAMEAANKPMPLPGGKVKDPLGDQVRERIRLINDETDAYNKTARVAQYRAELEASLSGMANDQKDIILATYDARVKYLNEIDRIEKQIAQTKIEQAGKSTDKEKDKIGEVIKALEEQKDKIKDLSEETRKFKEQQAAVSRQWSTGWNKAFNEYVDNATNAAMIAENIFKRATQGMEDAIVNFAKTGKFEFKNFVAMMAEELLRSQVRQLMAGIFTSSKGGGSSIWSGIKSIFGFASGGGVGQNTPILVGERGPELFLPGGNGTIVPNNQLGGGTRVTYNINAVDAASFKSMLARDPQFLYAVTEQGRKTIPGAR